jgi:hypothetical protein
MQHQGEEGGFRTLQQKGAQKLCQRVGLIAGTKRELRRVGGGGGGQSCNRSFRKTKM